MATAVDYGAYELAAATDLDIKDFCDGSCGICTAGGTCAKELCVCDYSLCVLSAAWETACTAVNVGEGFVDGFYFRVNDDF